MKEIIRKVYVNQPKQHVLTDIQARNEAQNTQKVDKAYPLQVEPRPSCVSSGDSQNTKRHVNQVVSHVHGEDTQQLTPSRIQDKHQTPHRQKGEPECRS